MLYQDGKRAKPSQACTSCFSSTHEFQDNEESGTSLSLSLSTYSRYNSLYTKSTRLQYLLLLYNTPAPRPTICRKQQAATRKAKRTARGARYY
jgi:hypothetical protein